MDENPYKAPLTEWSDPSRRKPNQIAVRAAWVALGLVALWFGIIAVGLAFYEVTGRWLF